MTGGPAQCRARVVDNEPVGAYHRITLAAPQVAQATEPGQFVAVAVGDEPTATLLRRCFSVHWAGRHPQWGDVVQIVVAAHGPGSAWVTRRRVDDVVDIVGPLGHGFAMPAPGAACVLVGGGYGSAPLTWFAERLAERGSQVDLVLGAATAARLFGADEGANVAARVHVTTDDGSSGTQGFVTTVLPGLLASSPPPDVYACGPMAMLRAVAALAADHGAHAWLAVEESMACGIGVCMTCVLPVRGQDGATRMVRSCVEGPTFAGTDIRWDAVLTGPGGKGSSVPADCLGAPVPGGH